jgi:antitoxin MazE
MQVAKWGNSLAIRIPSAVVDTLELKEGDNIVVRVADDRSKSAATTRIKSSRLKLPTG